MLGFEMTHIKLISPNWGIHHCLWHNDFNVLGDGHSNRLFFRRMSAVFIPMRRTMKKFNKVAMVLASAALATAAGAQSVDNWRTSSGELAWKNSAGDLCWRGANWTPATAAAGCDGAIVAPKAAAPAPAPARAPVAAAPAPAAAPVARPAPPPPAAATKVTYAADTFFDFDKSVLKADGKAKLDDLAGKVKAINLEVIIAVGHTDSTGSDAYNQKLSVKRADAVKAYLITKGIEKNRVYTEGKGEKQPVADNKTNAGRSKNRRVEIEVVGTRPN
jgi:OOP family OmpA-OmpF porin